MNSTKNKSQDFRRSAKLMLLANMMTSERADVDHEHYYVGVRRHSRHGRTSNVDYLVLKVESDYNSANVLHQEVSNFVTYYFDHVLMPMMGSPTATEGNATAYTFQMLVNETLSDLERKPDRLEDYTALLWDEIMDHQYNFEWKREFVRILRSLTVREMVEFYKEHILGENAKWISIQIFHQNEGGNNTDFGHQMWTDHQADGGPFLYLNDTKELQRSRNAQYYDVI